MQSFKTKSEANAWMVAKVDDPYIDNERFAYLDDIDAVKIYELQQADGCCGFFDEEVLINGREALIGCNYGH